MTDLETTPQGTTCLRPRNVLLVEDNPTDIFVITQILKQYALDEGLQVATDGAKALELWELMETCDLDASTEESCPGIVLLDLNIPKISGREILARIRSSDRFASVPVVVVTSSDSPDDLATIHALKASAYFRKPTDLFAFMELGTIIARLLPET